MSIIEIIKGQTVRPDQIAMITFFVSFILGEMIISAYRTTKLYELKDTLTNMFLGVLTFLAIVSVKGGVFIMFTYAYEYRLFDLIQTPWYYGVAYWVALLLLNDLMFYVFHFIAHKSRFFWALHVAHHNSKRFNFSVSIRGLFLLQVFKFPLWTIMPLLGFEPLDIFVMDSIIYFYQFWIHTELIGKLGFLEKFMNTPTHHQIHHSTTPELLNKNLGGVFIIWDRMFGTFAETKEPIQYGIPNNIETENPWVVGFHEFIVILRDLRQPGLTWKQRWDIVFGDLPFKKY